MDGTTSLSPSLQLILHAPFLCLSSFPFFSPPLSHLHNLSLSSSSSLCIFFALPPLHCVFYRLSSVLLPRRRPTLCLRMGVSERHSGLRKDLFSNAPASPPTCLNSLLSSTCRFLLYLLSPSCFLFHIDRATHSTNRLSSHIPQYTL